MAGRPKMRPQTEAVMTKDDHSKAIKRLTEMECHLRQLRQKRYCDVTLRIQLTSEDPYEDSEPFFGHRIILASESPYLNALFASGAPGQCDFIVPGLKRYTLGFLLNCIYNCDVGHIDENNMYQVCAGARLLQLSNIQSACEKFIESTRSIDTCLKIWSFGRREGFTTLQDPSYILKHFETVSGTHDFTVLTTDEIHGLMSASASPMVHLSDRILLNLYKWVDTNDVNEETEKRIAAFLSCVTKLPMEKLDNRVFAKVFLDDSLLKENVECHKFRDAYLCDFFVKHSDESDDVDVTATKVEEEVEEEQDDSPVLPKTEDAIEVTSPKRKAVGQLNNGTDDDVELIEKPVKRPRGRPPGVHGPYKKQHIDNGESALPREKRKSAGRPKSLSSDVDDAKKPGRPKKSLVGPTPVANFEGGHCLAYYIANDGYGWMVNSYNFQTGNNSRVVKFRHYRPNGVLLVANNFIYYLGGRAPGEKEDSNRIDLFNLSSKEWQSSDLLKLDEGRCFFNCAVLDDQIYIVAGYRDNSCIDSVERIPIGPARPPVEGEEEITNVKWPKNRSPLAVVDGKVYCVGGAVAEGGNAAAWASAYVESYDPKTNRWTDKARMPTPRVGHAVVVLDSKLYALGGGRSEETVKTLRLTDVECYDPKTNSWAVLAPMIKKRQYGSAFAFGGCIYAIGGDSPKSPTMEKYDPKTNSWELMQSSSLPREADYSTMIFQIGDDVAE